VRFSRSGLLGNQSTCVQCSGIAWAHCGRSNLATFRVVAIRKLSRNGFEETERNRPSLTARLLEPDFWGVSITGLENSPLLFVAYPLFQ
jgi:hypothetical protein